MTEKEIIEVVNYLEETGKFQKEQEERRVRRMKRAAAKWHRERFMLNCIACILLAVSALVLLVAFMCLKANAMAVETEPISLLEPLEFAPNVPVNDRIIIISGPGTVIDINCEPEYIIAFTEEERQLFEGIIAAESYSFWDYDDMLTLASVVMNRIQSDDFPDTLEGVLTQRKQFTTYSNGRYAEVEVTEACREAVDAALRGETNIDNDIFWFCTREYYESVEDEFFSSLSPADTCRNVVFFRE